MPDLLEHLDLYIIAIAGGDRPYVSTTPPSAERILVAQREGWEIRQVRLEMVRSANGAGRDRFVLTWDRRLC